MAKNDKKERNLKIEDKEAQTWTKKFCKARNIAISEEKNFMSTISRNRLAPKGAQEGWTAIVRAPKKN